MIRLLAPLLAAASPVELAGALAEQLHPPPGSPTGIAVRGPEPDRSALAGALRWALEQRGARVLLETDTATAAKAGGASHLVEVWLEPDGVRGQLSWVDRGLWAPIEASAPVLAAIRRPLDAAGIPRLGEPVLLVEWQEPVWGLALCGDLAVVAGPDDVSTVALDGGAVHRRALDGPPPATPVRAPLAFVRCGPKRVAVGTGRQASGVELNLPSLEPMASFPGLPIDFDRSAGRFRWLQPTEGRAEFGPEIPGRASLEASVIEIAYDGADGFAVTVDRQLRPVLPTGAFGAAAGPAGRGLSLHRDQEDLWVAVTGADRSAEELRVHARGKWLRRPLPGPATATAIGRPRGRPGVLVALPGRLVVVELLGIYP